MEELNKYYTPDISEFHIGFEYEFQNTSRYAWKPNVIDESNITPVIKDIQRGNTDYNYRVKYLDVADIESLGFKQYYEQYQFIKGNAIIVLKSDKSILIESGMNKFYGKIKNKSELKKLLIQLNIS